VSAVSNKFISHEEAVPLVSGDVFSDHEDDRFAIGVFNSNDIMSYKPDTKEQAYLKLRANVYIDRNKIFDNNVRRIDGTELDENDERSTHFVVFENLRMGRVAVFACMRLIQKSFDMNDELPIENLFPDSFIEPAPQDSIEVSRFIVCHEKSKYSTVAKLKLITAGLAHAIENDLGPIFGVIEPDLKKVLLRMSMPIEEIAKPQIVGEYTDENLGIEINKEIYSQHLGKEALKNMTVPVGSFGYWGKMLEVDDGKI